MRNTTHTLEIILVITLFSGCGQSVIEPLPEVVHCRNLLGERTAREVDAWKFDAITSATAEITVPNTGLTLRQIEQELRHSASKLTEDITDFDDVVRLVLLEMEVRGDFVRLDRELKTDDMTVFLREESQAISDTGASQG